MYEKMFLPLAVIRASKIMMDLKNIKGHLPFPKRRKNKPFALSISPTHPNKNSKIVQSPPTCSCGSRESLQFSLCRVQGLHLSKLWLFYYQRWFK